MKLKQFLDKKNIRTQVININNDALLKEAKGSKKYNKFCDKYNKRGYVVQIIDLNSNEIIQDNQ